MCGICGIVKFNHQPVEESKIRTMMARMKHRGPDDEGVFFDDNVGFGFVRLSILDLSPLGHQPMVDESGRFVIIHNGEVYNFIEIREELICKGYSFKSNTDTEVILKSYIEWGESCLDKFNGMWAFCIYETKTKEIFISRDRYGVKPFYYYLDADQFIFASEIPSILKILDSKPHANNQVIFDYLVFNRTDQTESTFFEGIKKLQHGHLLKIQGKNVSISKWYDLRKKVEQNEGFSDSREYRELFSSAIGLRLRSDVPVGVCLSGGLDSSSIVSVLLKDYHKNDLNTFSAVYGKNRHGDESNFIDLYKNDLLNMFFCVPSATTLFEELTEFIKSHAEPFPSTSIYAQFSVMKLAAKKVVVTLDGQGADESLGGYHDFFGYYFKEMLKARKFVEFGSEVFNYLWKHRSTFALKSMMFFLLPNFVQVKLRSKGKKHLSQIFTSKYSVSSEIPKLLYSSDSLNGALVDHFEYKLEHLLKWSDRNSMFFSIESRAPFLDYRLVEKSLSTKSNNLIQKGMTKSILRNAMQDTLPEKIRQRMDKIGFETPQADWFRQDYFKDIFLRLVTSHTFKERAIFSQKKCINLMEEHLSKRKDNSKEIWKIIVLELWFNYFID